jgi:cell division protein FtsW
MISVTGKRFDLSLLVVTIALVLFGIVMIYSASVILGYTVFNDSQLFFRKQIISGLIGALAMIAMSMVDYRVWAKKPGWMLGATFALLLSVFVFSRGEINGAHRWIEIGGFSMQPSEFGKLFFLMYLAAWLAKRQDKMADLKGTFLPFMLVLGAVSVLILEQPDFGTLSVFFVSAVAVYLVAGMTLPQFLIGAGTVAAGLTYILSAPYRRARLATFFDPSQDVSGIGWHIKNISIAIGSGGWFGLGFGASGQKRLFLPEPHTDSIFAIVTEELGFMVATLLIAAFIFLAYRGYKIALKAPDAFGRLLAVGITSWFAWQTFINLASMLQIIPLVGVPLPFVSYGGTNLIISMAAIGVLLNISKYGTDAPASAAQKAPQRRVRTPQRSGRRA